MGASSRTGKLSAAGSFLGRSILIVLLLLTSFRLIAQSPETKANPPFPGLALKPGEALVMTLGDNEVGVYGEARTEVPMGGLAELVWLRMEGVEWSARDIRYRCKGTEGALTCSAKAGHGHVNLGKALREGCSLAFLAWIQDAQRQWREDYGESVARARMVDVFAPFLGRRLAPGEALPPLTPAWVGEGDLLRTSPEALMRWLLEPDQGQVLNLGQRFLAGTWMEVKDLMGKESWWYKTASAPVPGDPSATSAWVVAGRGSALVVLHLARGRGDKEGMARIQEILKLNRG